MNSVIRQAVIEEVRDELDKRFPAADVPTHRRMQPRFLELGYVESVYRVEIEVDRDARVSGGLTRLPCHGLIQCDYRLSDPNLFSEIGKAVVRKINKDRLLVRALHRVGDNLLQLLHESLVLPEGWKVLDYSPAVDGNTVNVFLSFLPPVGRIALPPVSFRMVLAAYRSGKFKVSLATDKAQFDSDCSSVLWHIDTPESIQGKQFTAASLSNVVSLTIHHIESFVARRNCRLLPIESAHVSAQARQAMLVLVPLRIADAVRQTSDVEWCRDLTAACLDSLAANKAGPMSLIRKLFFQLIKVELSAEHEREEACRKYDRLGLELADQRKRSDSLPFNPALAYVVHDRAGLEDKLTNDDRRLYGWFLEHAALEQLVDLMGLV